MSAANGIDMNLLREIENLRLRLEEAEDTLRAIGAGEVDAFVVSSPAGEKVYTLKGAEYLYRVLVETMNEGAATLTPDGTILYANNRLATMLQISLETLIGTPLASYVAPADRPLFAARLSRSTVERDQDEIAMVTAQGNIIPVLVSYGGLDLTDSQVLSVVVTDITQQKLFDQAGEAIIVCDDRGRIIRVNKLARQLCLGDPLLQPFDSFIQLREAGTGRPVSLKSALPVGYTNIEVAFTGRSEEVRYFQFNVSLLKGADRSIGYTVTLNDITEKKRIEQKLLAMNEELERRVEQQTSELQEKHLQYLHAEKLAAMGQLSASIAHEFNNPLQGVMAILKGFQRSMALAEEDRKMLDMAISESERMKKLIRNLQDFNRPSLDRKMEMDVNEALDSLLLLCRSDFKRKKVMMELDYARDLPKIMAIPDQIKQVFLNLLTNAADACRGGGLITVRTRRAGERVAVAIEDTGTGIAPEQLELIFQPFYTSKAEEQIGTGLGLSICQGIVQDHQGEIQVASRPGHGSTFTVLLPIAADDTPGAGDR